MPYRSSRKCAATPPLSLHWFFGIQRFHPPKTAPHFAHETGTIYLVIEDKLSHYQRQPRKLCHSSRISVISLWHGLCLAEGSGTASCPERRGFERHGPAFRRSSVGPFSLVAATKQSTEGASTSLAHRLAASGHSGFTHGHPHRLLSDDAVQ